MYPEADTTYQALYRGSDTTLEGTSSIPRIPLDLRKHKTSLAITTAILLSFGCVLPLGLYYILKYAAHEDDTIAITVATVIFGAQSIVSMAMRLWSLLKKNSTSRPIGATKRHLDYFQIVYITFFVGLTALISAGSALPGNQNPNISKLALPIVSMGLPIIMIGTCLQQVVVFLIISFAPNTTYPFRISSMPKGAVLRPAAYTITEDVVAVDGKQGTDYRRMLDERYRFSKDIRALFLWADAVWGFSGVIVGAALIAVIWAVPNQNVGWVLAWVVPWIWASLFIWITVNKTKKVCKQENIRYASQAKEVVYASE